MGSHTRFEVPGVGEVGGWLARPAGTGPARGALVVVQEIFGVNAYVRSVAGRYAAAGFIALAPALFDPVERDVELGYDEAGFETGRALAASLGFPRAVAIVDAAARVVAALDADGGRPPGRVAVVGFCWGGSIAFLANTRLGLPAVGYYGARTLPFLDEPLRAPLLLHFGARDHAIPPADVEAHRRRLPAATIHVYGAGHGFDRHVDPLHHEPASAALAHARTLAFLDRALAADPGGAHAP